jgi:NitT/TauT family transport system substrate-binding protein
MRTLTRRSVVTGLATTMVAAAAGCSKSAPAVSGQAPDKVIYLTAFGAVGRDAFIWIAQEKGYFKDANIDVSIKLGAAADKNLQALSAGQAQFAALDLTGGVIQVGKGSYPDVRAFAAIHQRNLSSIIGVEGGSLSTPKDLVGKKVGVATGSVVKSLYPAYARLAGIDPTLIQWVEVAPAQLPPLLAAKQVDGLATFLIGTPAIEKAAGKKTVVLPFSTYLTDLYGNGLFTSAKIAQQSPDLVKRFRIAALKALQYSIDHPDEAGQILKKFNPTADAVAATGEIKLMTPYVGSAASGVTVGALEEQRVARGIAILQSSGLIPSGLTPDKIVNFSLAPNKG